LRKVKTENEFAMSKTTTAQGMSDVTTILERVEGGDPSAAEELLPLVYDELRRLAAARMAQETPGQTLGSKQEHNGLSIKRISPVPFSYSKRCAA